MTGIGGSHCGATPCESNEPMSLAAGLVAFRSFFILAALAAAVGLEVEIILLTDCTSPVPACEHRAEELYRMMNEVKGITFRRMTSEEYLRFD